MEDDMSIFVQLVEQPIEIASQWTISEEDKRRSFFKSIIDGKIEQMQHMINNGANVNDVEGSLKKTPLHIACSKGHKKMVELLLRNGANIDFTDLGGATPLREVLCYQTNETKRIIAKYCSNTCSMIAIQSNL